MNKNILLIVSVIVLLPLVFADSNIANNPVTLRITNNTLQVVSNYDIDNKNFTFNVTVYTEGNNTYYNIPTQEFVFDNYFIKNTSMSPDFFQQMLECEKEKLRLNTGWDTCILDCKRQVADCTPSQPLQDNLTKCNSDLSTCMISLSSKNGDLQTANTNLKTTQDDLNSKKNNWMIFGGIGLLIGAVGYHFISGKGGFSVKDRQSDTFNRQNAA